ncbi:MAG: DUF2974 domain-containing protein [Candidatus Saccharibacteria bacterium]|nr:DUF2974 domain-containing protein [Candidatus Saccharibacteria bacterium]
MANITTEQYLAVSALAYSDLSQFTERNLGRVIAEANSQKGVEQEIVKGYKHEKTGEISPEFHALSSLSDWVIVNAETYSSGMSAIALQNPDTKEVVFAFRGTELNDLGDIATDEQLFSGLTHTIPTQFHHAEQFVHNVLATKPDITNYSFTGHSLGGALAQYLTYKTDHRAVTFNAPGIGSVITSASGKKVDYTYYKDKAINYANESDVIGNYRNDTRIGTNTLIGGTGNDRLDGDTGNDTYIFNRGDGQDILVDTGGVDTIQLNYNTNVVMFERSGQDMYIRLHDSSDTIKITEQYRSDTKKIETFTAANGYSISHVQVDNLIQAMASFQQDTGMTWQQALQFQPDQTQQIIQQYWTPPTV